MNIWRIFQSTPTQETASINPEKATESAKTTNVTGLSSVDSLEVSQEQPVPGTIFRLPPWIQQTKLPELDKMPVFGTEKYGSSTADCCLTMILNYLGVNVHHPGVIENAIGRGSTETPEDMVDLARSYGLEAMRENNGTIEKLKEYVDKGLPVQAFISNADNTENESIVITGYGVDNSKKPAEEFIIYRDGVYGAEHNMPLDEFETRWAQGGPDLFEAGYKNSFIVYGPEGTAMGTGFNDGVEAISAVNKGIADTTAGWDRLVNGPGAGDRIHGFFQGLGGVTELVVGGAGWLIFSGPAQWLHEKVEGIPVLENFVQPLTGLWDTAGSIIGNVAHGVGELLDDWGTAFGSLASGDLEGFGRGLLDGVGSLYQGVADSVVDSINGAVDALGDIFSGW